SFDHLVTQWMSTVTVSDGNARNSSQVQDTGASTAPRIGNVPSSSGVCGVGPAERTGKSSVTYWPGGTRAGSPSERRRPLNPRETNDISPPQPYDGIPFVAVGIPRYPNVNAYASAPGSSNVISSVRSRTSPGSRTSWYRRPSRSRPFPFSSTSTPGEPPG